NRRLYNTASSSYITLEDLARMVRENVEFQVLDAKSGDDITHSILTQIIMEEEANGGQMLPVSFLRQLIGMYGNSMQALMPSYLEASMNNFRENQAKIREAFEKGMSAGPLAALHETNMAMMRAAADVFLPAMSKPKDKPAPPPPADELAELRAQMAAMQKRLDELGK
ncbi:MAG: polyhydroxyalkanoate synthesis repressor PhaR, partial [Erythrobacter cryptus]